MYTWTGSVRIGLYNILYIGSRWTQSTYKEKKIAFPSTNGFFLFLT